MSTAILRSRDCLQRRLPSETITPPPSLKAPVRNPNPNFSNALRRKRSPIASQSKSQDVNHRNHGSRAQPLSMVAKVPSKNLAMGQVKILKRGETLSFGPPADGANNRSVSTENRKPRSWKPRKEATDQVLGSRNRLGSEPKTVQKQIRAKEFNNVLDGIYAGSEFLASSPPPSSLPVPRFLGKIRQ